MSTDTSRREFISTVAVGAAMASRIEAQARIDLSIQFSGLALFVKETNKMTVGLLGHGHETIVIAPAGSFSAPGTTPTADQLRSWKATRSFPAGALSYWKGNTLAIRVTPITTSLTATPLAVFPLKAAASTGASLPANWTTKCQSALTFDKGSFRSLSLVSPTEPCQHENQTWSLVDGASYSKSHGTILSVVQYDAEVSAATLVIGGTSLTVSGSTRILILQHPVTPPAMPNPARAEDCKHYFTLLQGHTGPTLFPQRTVSPGCVKAFGGDPVYCPPGTF